ncbi:hypothetical protein [Halalkaliarchaeum desulfuricum]|nr:hypothetical protein [Halalkaliarchaeum desulfuricum]
MNSGKGPSISRRRSLQLLPLSLIGLGLGTTREAASEGVRFNPISDNVTIPAPNLEEAFLPTMKGTPLVPRYEVDTGWDELSYDEFLDVQLQFDPDVFLFHRNAGRRGSIEIDGIPDNFRELGRMAIDTGIPGLMTRSNTLSPWQAQPWYEGLNEEEQFTYPDGSAVTEIDALVAKNRDGDPHVLKEEDQGSVKVLSPFADGTIEFLATPMIEAVEFGYSTFFIDFAKLQRLGGLDHSVWAESAFRDHLEKLSSNELRTLGLEDDDVDSFDVSEYLTDLELGNDEPPAVDPIYREFLLLQHKAIKQQFEQVIDTVRSADLPTERVEFYANGFMGDDFRNTPDLMHIHDPFDLVFLEDTPSVPPDFVRDFVYKFGVAAGHFQKPVILHRSMWEGYDALQGLDPADEYPTLLQLQVAEAYANGCRKPPNLSGGAGHTHREKVVNNWVREDGTVPDVLLDFVKFVRVHERFLMDPDPENDVAVVYSLPTMLWHYAPEWDWYAMDHIESFRGAVQILRRLNYAYDVIIFGHDDLWDDSEQLDRLAQYDAVLFPNVAAISDEQVMALNEALDQGTTMIATGGFPSRDEQYMTTIDTGESVTHRNSIVFSDDLTSSALDTTVPDDLNAALTDSVTRTIRFSGDIDVGLTIMGQADNEQTIIHFVNYEYNPTDDSMAVHTSLNVTIDLEAVTGVHYYSPKGRGELSTDVNDDGYQVTIPRLETWVFLVVNHSTEDLMPPGSEDEARAAIVEADSAISTAEDEGRTYRLYRATRRRENAEAYFDHESYKLAKENATKAKQEAEMAVAPPSVGFYTGHDPRDLYRSDVIDDLAWYFRGVEFDTVDHLSDLEDGSFNLLIVPPALPWKGSRYEFSTADLDLLEEFVDDGNGLLIVGRGDIDSDINLLLERFDIEVDLAPIDSESRDVYARTILHPLSKLTPKLDMTLGTPLSTVPNEMTVLAEIPDDSNAFLDHSGTGTKDMEDESAAGKPVFGYRPYGDGTVTYFGNNTLFEDINRDNYSLEREVVWNYIDVVGQVLARTDAGESRENNLNDEDDTDESQDQTDSEDIESAKTEQVPGFEIGTAIAAICGTLYLQKRRFEDRRRDEDS